MIHQKRKGLLAISVLTLVSIFCVGEVFGQGGKAEPKRVQFARGKSTTILSGTLSNNVQMEYVFGAKAGQTIKLKVTSNPKGGFFDFGVDGDGFDVETDLDTYSDYSFKAPRDGDYLVFVRKRPTTNVPRAKFFLSLSIK
jgi:hypothetical protein